MGKQGKGQLCYRQLSVWIELLHDGTILFQNATGHQRAPFLAMVCVCVCLLSVEVHYGAPEQQNTEKTFTLDRFDD